MSCVHIISGFLGAGKTTLLKKLLGFSEGKKVIIENEFGETGIDAKILQRDHYDVVEMTQGCVCCSMKADFVSVMDSVIADYKPQHIFIEPTGIAMLSQIIDVFIRKEAFLKCRLTLPIVVVDALEYLDMVEDYGLFFQDQIASAGVIVLSKTQLMVEDNMEEILKSLRRINRQADILTKDWELFSELDYWELTHRLFDSGRLLPSPAGISIISGNLEAYSVKNPRPLSREKLQKILENLQDRELGRIIRAKGFVENDQGSLEFSYVNGRYSIIENKPGNASRICIIGSNLEPSRLLSLWGEDKEVFI